MAGIGMGGSQAIPDRAPVKTPAWIQAKVLRRTGAGLSVELEVAITARTIWLIVREAGLPITRLEARRMARRVREGR